MLKSEMSVDEYPRRKEELLLVAQAEGNLRCGTRIIGSALSCYVLISCMLLVTLSWKNYNSSGVGEIETKLDS